MLQTVSAENVLTSSTVTFNNEVISNTENSDYQKWLSISNQLICGEIKTSRCCELNFLPCYKNLSLMEYKRKCYLTPGSLTFRDTVIANNAYRLSYTFDNFKQVYAEYSKPDYYDILSENIEMHITYSGARIITRTKQTDNKFTSVSLMTDGNVYYLDMEFMVRIRN
ncbi:MAG: hypothetical protein ACYTFY_20530 [Planctomycetota bacterium]|jgi:hypothetical protein